MRGKKKPSRSKTKRLVEARDEDRGVKSHKMTNSVFRIEIYVPYPNQQEPWNSHVNDSSRGTGFLIRDKLILTCAHVVESALVIYVKRFDLAVLQVDDADFYDDLIPFQFSKKAVETNLETYALGYSAAGETLQTTSGVISSFEGEEYLQSGKEFAKIITDTTINAGCSGGCLVSARNGKVVGVNFEGDTELNNVGKAIPVEIIEQFLKSVSLTATQGNIHDDVTTSFFGYSMQSTENETLRKLLQMGPQRSGLLVTAVEVHHPQPILKVGDVLQSVDGIGIDNEGNVELNKRKLPVKCYLNLKEVGDDMVLKVFRNGEDIEITERLLHNERDYLPIRRLNGTKPSYYIYGGVAFLVVSQELMEAYEDNEEYVDPSLTDLCESHLLCEPHEEKVMIQEIFPHSKQFTEGFPYAAKYDLVESVLFCTYKGEIKQQVKIDNMKRLVYCFKKTFPENDDMIVVVRTKKNKMILAFDRAAAPQSNQEILKEQNIFNYCSEDLLAYETTGGE